MARTAQSNGTAASSRSGVSLAVAAVIMFSTSPIFVLLAQPLSPYEITVGRLAVGALLVIALGRINKQPLLPARAHLPVFALFGLITAETETPGSRVRTGQLFERIYLTAERYGLGLQPISQLVEDETARASSGRVTRRALWTSEAGGSYSPNRAATTSSKPSSCSAKLGPSP